MEESAKLAGLADRLGEIADRHVESTALACDVIAVLREELRSARAYLAASDEGSYFEHLKACKEIEMRVTRVTHNKKGSQP